MTLVFSIIAVAALLSTIAKFITKRLHFKKADRVLAKIHCRLAYLLIIAAIIHMVSSFSVFHSRPLYIYLLGALMILLMLVAAFSYRYRKTLGKKWIIIHRTAALLICLTLLCHVGLYFYSFINYQKKVSSIEISAIDSSQIADGDYVGEYDVEFIYAKVDVTVKNGKIQNIDILEHRNERGKRAESIAEDILKEQKVNVDAVSGATNSSRVIEKAVENALCSATKK